MGCPIRDLEDAVSAPAARVFSVSAIRPPLRYTSLQHVSARHSHTLTRFYKCISPRALTFNRVELSVLRIILSTNPAISIGFGYAGLEVGERYQTRQFIKYQDSILGSMMRQAYALVAALSVNTIVKLTLSITIKTKNANYSRYVARSLFPCLVHALIRRFQRSSRAPDAPLAGPVRAAQAHAADARRLSHHAPDRRIQLARSRQADSGRV